MFERVRAHVVVFALDAQLAGTRDLPRKPAGVAERHHFVARAVDDQARHSHARQTWRKLEAVEQSAQFAE